MDSVNFKNEKIYLITMNIVKNLLNQKLVTKEEYMQIDKIFKEKYEPTFSNLFAEILY